MTAGDFRRLLQDVERELRRDDRLVAADVVGRDGDGSVGPLGGDEGLSAGHTGPGRVNSPRHPATGARRRRREGNGEGVVRLVVGPVELRRENRKVFAMREGSAGELPRFAALRLRGRDQDHGERRHREDQNRHRIRRHWRFFRDFLVGGREKNQGLEDIFLFGDYKPLKSCNELFELVCFMFI